MLWLDASTARERAGSLVEAALAARRAQEGSLVYALRDAAAAGSAALLQYDPLVEVLPTALWPLLRQQTRRAASGRHVRIGEESVRCRSPFRPPSVSRTLLVAQGSGAIRGRAPIRRS